VRLTCWASSCIPRAPGANAEAMEGVIKSFWVGWEVFLPNICGRGAGQGIVNSDIPNQFQSVSKSCIQKLGFAYRAQQQGTQSCPLILQWPRTSSLEAHCRIPTPNTPTESTESKIRAILGKQ